MAFNAPGITPSAASGYLGGLKARERSAAARRPLPHAQDASSLALLLPKITLRDGRNWCAKRSYGQPERR